MFTMCPKCKEMLDYTEDDQGTVQPCPSCGRNVQIPEDKLQSKPVSRGQHEQLDELLQTSKAQANTLREIRNLIAALMILWLIGFVIYLIASS